MKDSRVNKFEAEDFYVKRHLLTEIEEMARTGASSLPQQQGYKLRPSPNPFQSFATTQASKNTLYGLKLGHRSGDGVHVGSNSPMDGDGHSPRMLNNGSSKDIIHVTIDRTSLQQLSQLTSKEIFEEENVELVTKSAVGQL